MIKMNNKMYKGLAGAVAVASLPYLAGCSLMPATRGYVDRNVAGVQKQVAGLEDNVQKQYSGLSAQVQKVKERTRAEGVASLFYGEGYDGQVGMMLARIMDKYNQSDRAILQKIIDRYGNRIGVAVVSTNDGNVYPAFVVVDGVGGADTKDNGDGNKKLTFGGKDRDKLVRLAGKDGVKISPQDLTPEIWKRLVEIVSK